MCAGGEVHFRGSVQQSGTSNIFPLPKTHPEATCPIQSSESFQKLPKDTLTSKIQASAPKPKKDFYLDPGVSPGQRWLQYIKTAFLDSGIVYVGGDNSISPGLSRPAPSDWRTIRCYGETRGAHPNGYLEDKNFYFPTPPFLTIVYIKMNVQFFKKNSNSWSPEGKRMLEEGRCGTTGGAGHLF